MRRHLLQCSLLLVGLLCALALHEAAKAYSSIRVSDTANAAFGTEVRWNPAATGRTNISNGRILYKVGAAGTTNTITGPGDEVSEVQRAFEAWGAVEGLSLEFEFDGLVTTPVEDGNDDINTVYWATGDFGPGELAVTTTTFDTATGEILDADLAFNDDFVWDTIADTTSLGTPGRTYIRSVGIHEIGHFLGLDHSFHGPATLFPFTDEGAISPISLEHDDVAGLIKDHPLTSPLTPNRTSTVAGTVIVTGGGGVNGVMVTLIDVETGSPVVSSLSERAHGAVNDGEYLIPQVPAGNYWVFATPILPGEIGAYFSGAFTNFIARVHGVPSGSVGAPTILRVGPNQAITGIDFALDALDPFEPNDTTANATPIAIGEAAAAIIGSQNDIDLFSFTAEAGERVTIQVHADGQGSALNPYFVVSDSNNTTRLLSGDFNDSTETYYVEAARDINADAFARTALNFDARAVFTAPSTGTFHILVDGSSFTTGFYVLTLNSDRDFAGVDVGTTRLLPALPSMPIGGAMTIAVEPRTTRNVPIPNSQTHLVELLDVSGGGSVVVDTKNSMGPWAFAASAPALAGTRSYQARVDGVLMNHFLEVDVYGAVDATTSIVESARASLVIDGVSPSLIRVGLFDATGQRVTDTSQNVVITTTAGNLTAGSASGQSVPGLFNIQSGNWEATLAAPTSGTIAMVSASANGMSVGSTMVTLKPLATKSGATTGGGGTSSSDSGGGGGCALANHDSQWSWLFGLVALAAHIALRRREDVVKND